MKLVENQAFRKSVRDFLLPKLYGKRLYELNRKNVMLYVDGALTFLKDKDFLLLLEEEIISVSSLDAKDSADLASAIGRIREILETEG